MIYETVIATKEGPLGWISLNRPEQFNTFSSTLARELNSALREFDKEDEIRVVIIRGEGKAFSAGIDVKEFHGKSPTEYYAWISLMNEMHFTIASMKKPVIAMVHGYAVANGAGLMFAADFSIVAEGTKIGTTAINVGLLCTGPIIPVAYKLGKHKSLEMLLSGDMIDAREAERLGIINKVVPPEELEQETRAFAQKLVDKSPLAIALGKEFYYKVLDMPFTQRFVYASEVLARLCTTEDAREGVSAFTEKRRPQWKGI
jgi:enoyl-CoA hydratase/carnithine racemase